MHRFAAALILMLPLSAAGHTPEFRDLFNGKDLAGWVNVNTAETRGQSRMAC